VAGCTPRNIDRRDSDRRVVPDPRTPRLQGHTKGEVGNGVVSCDIYDTGEYGIILGGGDRKMLAPGRNYAVNNDIHHFGRWVRTYRPAVFLYGVGNRVAHNRMHDAPHTALFWGNDRPEFNEVYGCARIPATLDLLYRTRPR
jgi:hypothetical protein